MQEKRSILLNPLVPQALSVVAIVISIASLFISCTEVKLIEEETTFTTEYTLQSIEIDCKTAKMPPQFTFVSKNEYGFLKIPITCTLRNTGHKSFSVAEIHPVLFKQDVLNKSLVLNRGSKEEMLLDIFWLNNIPRDFDISFPFEVKGRGVETFNGAVAMPIWFSSNHGNNGIYFQLIKDFPNRRKMYATVGNCLTSAEINSCFKKLTGKSLANYLYEGAEFPSMYQGLHVNGVGIKIDLFNRYQIIEEVDLRRFGNYIPNKTLSILNDSIEHNKL